MKKKDLTGAEYICELLKHNDITHVFYQELAFYFTTKIMKDYGLKNILAHSEGAAGYMADGYSRATGKACVCMSQAIGSANLAASLHDAWLGSTPVVALTGFKMNSAYQRNGYQESDHRAHFSGVTKYNDYTLDEQQLPFMLRQCLREATTGQPRPTHLDVVGYAGEMAEKAIMNDTYIPDTKISAIPAFRAYAPEGDIKAAADIINEAKKPVIVAGRGAKISDFSGTSIYELAAKADIPVATTPDGKSIIDETDPLWAGVVGGYGMDCANKTTAASDLVIYIGSMVSDQTTLNFTAPKMGTNIIQIDIEGAQIGKNYENTTGLLGDAKLVTEQLTAAINKNERPKWRDEIKAFVNDTNSKQLKIAHNNRAPIQTACLCKDLSSLLPDDAIVVADTGWSATWASTMFRMKPSQLFMRAAGSLGWSYPASLGAKCGAPEKPVICFCGDGGFYYHMAEMETAVRYGINTVTIVNNNSRLNQCIPYVGEAYTGASDNYNDYREKVTFQKISFAEIAEKFGVTGIKIESTKDIAPAIKKALLMKNPVVIEVITDWSSDGPLPAFE
ncbi:MAG: thiamine pyrophosphate-binding protein [Clostridiales bacterium]|nr:thiamine pyrophosphate-binding protein [Clostridiales bacterium]